MVQNEPSVEFIDLFLSNQAMIYAFVRSLIPNSADAEEVFQQVGLTLWRKKDSFDPELGSFRAWAIGVARNHIRNFARHQVRQRRLHVFSPEVLDRIADGWQHFDATWIERQEALTHCMKELDAIDRRRLERYYGGDARAKEMAEAEGLPLRTFYRRIQKLRECLLECISRTMEAEGGVHGYG